MLRLLDILLTLVHFIIIGFNLFGWIWPRTRKWHLACIVLTAGSWLLLGIWFGIGYCPVTDWQWQVKERLGETALPDSFITYYAEKITGQTFSDSFINLMTALFFSAAALLSVYVNFFRKRKNV